jgi:ketosteroid isomerase-like protein
MRVYLIFVALSLAGCCLWSCQTLAPPPPALSDPTEVVTALTHAFNNLDVDELRILFAEDATAFLPFASTGERLNGREAIIRAIEPMFAGERVRSSHGAPFLDLTAKDVKVQWIGHDVAIVSFDVGNKQVFSRRTLILQIIAGRWRVVHLHASNIRPDRGG